MKSINKRLKELKVISLQQEEGLATDTIDKLDQLQDDIVEIITKNTADSLISGKKYKNKEYLLEKYYSIEADIFKRSLGIETAYLIAKTIAEDNTKVIIQMAAERIARDMNQASEEVIKEHLKILVEEGQLTASVDEDTLEVRFQAAA